LNQVKVMKKGLFDLILYMFTFVFVMMFFPSVKLPTDSVYLFSALLLVGIGIMFSKYLLTFLTVKVVFLTRLIAITLILFGVIFALETFLPGFVVDKLVFSETDLGFLSLKTFEFDKIGVVVLLSFCTAFVSSIVKLLQES
jgi:hypothetical protein